MPRLGISLAIAVIVPLCVMAQRLPVKNYTAADGLASNSIRWIVPDSRGFLWFCTPEGLSRFDGNQFTTYGREHGLPDVDVYDLLETRRGEYWVATGSGVCRLRPSSREGRGHFEVHRPDGNKTTVMTSLLEDQDGSIWCGSDEGLFRLDERGGRWVMTKIDLGAPTETSAQSEINGLLRDRRGDLWIAAFSGIYRRTLDGRIDRFTGRRGLPGPIATALMEDSKGRIWVGTGTGLFRFKPAPRPGELNVDRVYTTKNGLPGNYIRTLLESADGSLWIGTLSGLARTDWIRNPAAAVEAYSAAQGLKGTDIAALVHDRDSNIWVGSAGGAKKIARTGFLTFTETAGLVSSNAVSIFENQAGEICVVTLAAGRQAIHRFDGRRYIASSLRLAESEHLTGRSANQTALQDRAGRWWFADGRTILRFPPLAFDRLAHFRPRDAFRDPGGRGVAFRVFEDSRGDIWASYSSWTRHGLRRWERATGRWQSFSEDDGLPPMGVNLPWVFAEDRHGNVWVGMSQNGLARYRNGRFQHFGPMAGRVRSLHSDSVGRLWAGWGSRGILRIDDPAAPELDLGRVYSKEQGLRGDIVHSIAEDRDGRIYVGLSGGVDRIDPKQPPGSLWVDHFTEGDGLAPGTVQAAYRDRSGALWFGTPSGISRFVPEARREQNPAPAFITGLRSGNHRIPVSELGERHAVGLRFPPDQKQLEVEFVVPSFAAGGMPLYQTRLVGADPGWGPPSPQRSVNYANLAAGKYQFLVRAVTPRDLTGEQASLDFEIMAPIWRRWWFLALSLALVAAGATGVHRFRVARHVEMERVRVRIATDLHDDIGSGLSQLAILSEMVGRRLDGSTRGVAEPLARMAVVSRELVDSMEEIVWSINPARDRIQDLSRRMRQFAGELLESRGVEFELHVSGEIGDVPLDAGSRRQLYLVFKEAIHNLRHSGCSKAVATLALLDRELVVEVRDNGGGFPSTAQNGHGLNSMRERARQLGGRLEIESTAAGAALRVSVPLGRSILRTNVGGDAAKLR